MLERRDDHSYDYNLHEARLPVRIQWHFLGTSGLPVAVQSWELPVGGHEGMHSHPSDPADPSKHVPALEEIYLVTEGTGRMTVGGETYDLGPGDAVLALPDVEHDLVNTGDVPLRLVVVWGAQGPSDYSRYASVRAGLQARGQA